MIGVENEIKKEKSNNNNCRPHESKLYVYSICDIDGTNQTNDATQCDIDGPTGHTHTGGIVWLPPHQCSAKHASTALYSEKVCTHTCSGLHF